MQIMLEIADGIAAQLADSRETLTRRSLELLAVEAYRKGAIGAGTVGQMLGFSSRWDTYDFLKRENAEPPFGEDDLESDRAALDSLLS
jgi:predicted HTH domain antitoxin